MVSLRWSPVTSWPWTKTPDVSPSALVSEDDADEQLFGHIAGSNDPHAHLRFDQRFARDRRGVEQSGEFLARQFGQGFGEGLADQLALAGKLGKRRIGHDEAVIVALQQSREARRLLEHPAKLIAFAG